MDVKTSLRTPRAQRILVTGSAGYIGSVMVPLLRSLGHRVEGLDAGFFVGCDLDDSAVEPLGRRRDVREIAPRDLEGFDAVVHLAALCNDPLGNLNPELTLEINFRASVRLAKLAREAGVKRFLYASSCSMYGVSDDDLVDENAPLHPITAYAKSKVLSEESISKLASTGFSPVFMRNATAYGLSPRLRGDVVLNNLTCAAWATGRILITSDGTPWRPIVHVEDIARAFAAAIDAPVERIHNQAFNIGSNSENYQVREIAEIVRQVMPQCEIAYAKGGGPDPRSYRVDFARFRRAIPEYTTVWDAPSAVRQLCNAFDSTGASAQELTNGKFIRLAHLNQLLAAGKLDSSLRWNGREKEDGARIVA
jgi:nucleoside-diphosphate-sugar epimerase